jgi:hypothetical protein
MVAVEFLAIVLTGLGLMVSIIYYASILRNANKTQLLQLETRQAQLFMQIYDKFVTKDFQNDCRILLRVWEWDDYDDYRNKYSSANNLEASSRLATVFHYFEGVGVLVEENLVDSKMVAKLLSANVIQIWEKFGPIFLEFRVKANLPRVYDKTELLYNEMKKLREDDWNYSK